MVANITSSRRPLRIAYLALAVVACIVPVIASEQTNNFVRAADSGDLTTVSALLQSGIDVNSEGSPKKGFPSSTALVAASRSGRLEVVQVLLTAKADVNISGGAALIAASGQGDAKVVGALLAAGADPNLDTGLTPLTEATLQNHLEVVQALLAAKAKVDAKGKTSIGRPLFEASMHDRLAILQALVAAGADVNAIQTTDGRTAVMAAAAGVQPGGVRVLIQAGANVNAMTYSGVTPLMIAAGRNDSALVEALLAVHADANGGFRVCSNAFPAPNPGSTSGINGANAMGLFSTLAGSSPLGVASAVGNLTVVRALLTAKADANRVQCDGKTALQIARENGHREVATLLEAAGATR
ncbi:MAG: ankyrin repeat domain-containing protein [Acidobacteriota bacterium]